MLTVYTTVFGFDRAPREPMHPQGARFVCFTDQPQLNSEHWEMVLLPTMRYPRRASRCLKALSHEAFPEAKATLWMDAGFILLVPAQVLGKICKADFMTHRHRERTRISEEADAIIRLNKGQPEGIRAQLAAYRAAGFDTEANPQHHLSENGVIYRRHTEAVKHLNRAWWHELNTRSLRDQMSLDYCLWRQAMKPGLFPGDIDRNPFFKYTRFKRPTNDH